MMDSSFAFSYLIDKYLETSNVYSLLRIDAQEAYKKSAGNSDRVKKLLALIEKVNPSHKSGPIKHGTLADVQGRTIADAKDLYASTKKYQKEVLQRINNQSILNEAPRNVNKLKNALQLDAEDFLGAFPNPTYAWDVLAELASLTVCPSAKALANRDMIHMSALEFQRHLFRVVAQHRLSVDASHIQLKGDLDLNELKKADNNGKLLEVLVEYSVPRELNALFDELNVCIAKAPSTVHEWVTKSNEETKRRIREETSAFAASGVPDNDDDVAEICDKFVLLGLVLAFVTWYYRIRLNESEIGLFRIKLNFCTRILLDEQRWNVCRDFIPLALPFLEALNKEFSSSAPKQGYGMLTANYFFARKKSGEDSTKLFQEIEKWDVSDLHLRYRFLRLVLLERYEEAADVLSGLVVPSSITGRPDFCREEIDEWPILHEFRNSPPGKRFCAVTI